MKYTEEIIIDSPREKVIALYDNPDYYPDWMAGLQKFEVLEGEANQPGSKSMYKFKMGKREMEMTETITKRDLPDEIERQYVSKGVLNIQKTRFEKVGENKTRLLTEDEFQFNGILMKLIAFLMPGTFKKQTRKYLADFKDFVESDHSDNR